MRLECYDEPVPRTGTIDGGAAKRALGKAKMGFWDVVLRESVQNSWDARLTDRISFDVKGFTFNEDQRQVLAQKVFSDLGGDGNGMLKEWLTSPILRGLVLRDSGTRGLGGPVDASTALEAEDGSDFRNFVFDIGRDPRREMGGGTYGFGKGVLYESSSVSTCLVYSRTAVRNADPVDRFIVVSVGSSYNANGRKYTGRRWWGTLDRTIDGQTGVLPIEGSEAKSLAAELGMGIPDGKTGTCISILDPSEPDTPAESMEAIVTEIRDAIVKWAWPHLVSLDGEPSIDFSVISGDNELSLSIESDPDISPFAEAYRQVLRRQADGEYEPPFTLTVHRVPNDAERNQTGLLGLRTVNISGPAPALNNTVALMRKPRFIVDYMKISPDDRGAVRVGVFVAKDSKEIEDAFAKSEPVTHDKWSREAGRAKHKPVAWTLDAIKGLTTLYDPPSSPNSTGEATVGLARVSRILASALVGSTGTGAERQPYSGGTSGGGGKGGKSKSKKLRAQVEGPPRFIESDATHVLVEFDVKTELEDPNQDLRKILAAKIRIKSEAGQMTTREDREAVIDGWYDNTGRRVAEATECFAFQDAHSVEGLRLRVRHLKAVAVTVDALLRESKTP